MHKTINARFLIIVIFSRICLFVAWFIDFGYEKSRPPQYVLIAIELFKTIGATGLALAFLNIWVETDDWRGYFEDRIKSIVIQQDYMKNLDKSTLDVVLRNLMKARFTSAAIDKEDGFLDHFEKNISKSIGTPFRENVVAIVCYAEETERKWIVSDTMEFVCRKVGAGIQERLTWESDEAEEVRSLAVWVSRPSHDGYDAPERLIALSEEKDALSVMKKGLDLSKFRDVDELKVRIVANYTQDRSVYYAWAMAHPSKNIDVQVILLDGYKLRFDSLVTRPRDIDKNIGSTYVRLIYKGWLLPENGLVWQILPDHDNPVSKREHT